MPEPGHGADAGPVLLYDGVCGFCDRTVRFLLRMDRDGFLRYAPLDGTFAQGVLDRHPDLAGVDSLVLVEKGSGSSDTVSVRSEALLRILRHLGGPWRLLGIAALIPRGLRDWLYDTFARHRYRVFGRLDHCPVPAPEVRSRFLE